jgi:hypothetical protein
MSFSVFDHTSSAVPVKFQNSRRSQPMLPRRIDGNLKSGSMTSISFVNVPAVAPVTAVGCAAGFATNGMLFALLNDAPIRRKSRPVFPN